MNVQAFLMCPLCHHDQIHVHERGIQRPLSFIEVMICSRCHLVFVPQKYHLRPEQEKARYATHQNHIENEGYVTFLSKLLSPLENFITSPAKGLDYGCGPGPVLSQLMAEQGHEFVNYDPFFEKRPQRLKQKYDVVTSTETCEHFFHPYQDFQVMLNALKSDGVLGLMTLMYDEAMDFKTWWYVKDPTHVAFYHMKTFEYLCDVFELTLLYHDSRVVILRKGISA